MQVPFNHFAFFTLKNNRLIKPESILNKVRRIYWPIPLVLWQHCILCSNFTSRIHCRVRDDHIVLGAGKTKRRGRPLFSDDKPERWPTRDLWPVRLRPTSSDESIRTLLRVLDYRNWSLFIITSLFLKTIVWFIN